MSNERIELKSLNECINMDSLPAYKNVSISCPICQAKKIIKIPISIIDQSKQLTTISIPRGKVCKHHFQTFVDKNFRIRGFQKVDYEVKKQDPKNEKSETLGKTMSLKEIYEEFWEYISDKNEVFRKFIANDTRREKNLNQSEISNPDESDFLPHVCKNLE